MKRLVLLPIVLLAGSARAQPAPVSPEPISVTADLTQTPVKADDATCLTLDLAPGALLQPAPGVPTPFSEFVVEGDLVDPAATVHALLEPTLSQYGTVLPAASWVEISKMAAKYGYQFVGHRSDGSKLALHLAPLPIVRKVDVDIDQSILDKLLDEEVKRRLRLRTGSYVPWEPIRRQCMLIDERKRIEEYLHDEGYFEAAVDIVTATEKGAIKLRVDVDLGKEYKIGRIEIPPQPSGEPLAITDAEIRAQFQHKATCILFFCFGSERFTRTQHQIDVQHVKELFHKRGFPGVRVQSNFDPRTSFDRRTKTVKVALAIDQRRQLDVQFEGFNYNGFSLWDLQQKLTFEQAGSADDVEAAQSAHAITTFLQERGFFDARATWTRERFESRASPLDKVVYRIDLGGNREVSAIEFVGNHALDAKALSDIIVTQVATLDIRGALFGGSTSASSDQIATDVERIKEAYRRRGYRDAQVRLSISTEGALLDNAAATAPLVASGREGNLVVRFTIEEGQPTKLVQVVVDQGDEGQHLEPRLCDQILSELSTELAAPQLAKRDTSKPAMGESCVAVAANVDFQEDDVAGTRDRLRDWLFKIGRPRSVVDYSATEIGPHRVRARYTVSKLQPIKIGKVLLRGNFHTADWVILDELRLRAGDPLTTDALAEGARRLRNTGLFDAVNIDLPELENRDNNSDIVNAIVRIEERYDQKALFELEAGLSSFNGLFGTVRLTTRNLFGRGFSWMGQVTYGTKITDLETTFAIPAWIPRVWLHSPLDIRTELSALYRQQDTARFGQLTTEGFSFALSWRPERLQRQRSATQQARAINFGAHYDWRVRSRFIDVLRPIGVDSDQSQVAISTRSGSFGGTFEWEQRVDRHGSLAPLSAEDGFHLEASAAIYSPKLAGQDTFFKVSAAVSRFIPIGDNLVIRGDLRYDEGFPLGGAALLPEVERYFAGGDNTVRGYNDDQMSTQLIQVAVPPLYNVTQIKVVPSGGNIRMLASIDAQLRIWSVFAGAVFSDAGMISNQWSSVTASDIRPSVGSGLRILSPFGIGAIEYAVPLRLQLGDDPRGRWHLYFAARAQF
ncbi:MAG: surface antigen [Myxococcales bacterium]|nr:surface antigen [Myxococcales bacterium]